MFFSTDYPIVVEGCAFPENAYFNWYDVEGPSSYARSEEGVILDASALMKMERSEAEFSFPEPEQKAVSLNEGQDADGNRIVYAETVDEFLAAIGPNTVIYLTGAEYRLADAADYGMGFENYYRWENV